MSDRSPRRPRVPFWFVGLLALCLAACTGATASPPASQAPIGPSVSVPPSGVDPAAVIDVDTLLRDAAARDGQVVRVTGNFLADEGSAQLCDVLMESYPPQCGVGVRLTGTVPSDTLDRLTTTKEPDLKKAWWGFVTVTGTFHAAGVDGRPTIEIADIEVAPAGG